MRQINLIVKTFVITALLIISGCGDSVEEIEVDEIEINEPNKENPSIRYLALGDSYTIGQGVSESARWPVQLSQQIEQESSLVVELDIIAQTGWTTSNLIRAIESNDIDSADYNLVSLLIGVNNQYQNKPFSLYEIEFDSLLQIAIEIAGEKGNVFVVSIPDYGVTPFGSSNSETIAKEIDQYNSYAKSRCNDAEVPFIDITSISRELGASSGALAEDDLHPSGYQYSLWTDRILPRVLELINE
ncbi:SGNH/GDSL hydrolase family protein [Marivirga sp.]|uniref:SGNH/GDSL hydrolase family protein n=1 Tax=Marivirga sp. TaxID=2018662 RepID=UPI0025E71B6A|nr:SGNH/GDSL hydrolase family protein [Marivirga sp.]